MALYLNLRWTQESRELFLFNVFTVNGIGRGSETDGGFGGGTGIFDCKENTEDENGTNVSLLVKFSFDSSFVDKLVFPKARFINLLRLSKAICLSFKRKINMDVLLIK